ncbi:hypothetical protein E3T54_11930 [Cryobacterium sp. Sr8]|uniref:J domain-containing protein n=1 Tax=Cryobacterium sp. Sr8 TaxID=1259203 RepID=UPI00106A9CA4|nr:J domain-containing protein [Cryobacterium sp. Sr8]TFD75435.1 hypothetical protein E3T54_11930 [Cryobacterium sp. Sr8]
MTPEVASAILNVSATASRLEIDKAFKLRARMSHPDRFSGAPASDIAAATAEFIRVTQARDVLHAHLSERRPAQPKEEPVNPDYSFEARRTPPMSFEEFTQARAAHDWVGGPQKRAPQPPAANDAHPMRAPVRRQTGWEKVRRDRVINSIVVIAVLALVGIVTAASGYMQGNTDTADQQSAEQSGGQIDGALEAANEESAAVSGEILSRVEVEFVTDDASYERFCTGSSGCWVWTVISPVACTSAAVKIVRAYTIDGDPTSSNLQYMDLRPGEIKTVVQESSSREEFASITSIIC